MKAVICCINSKYIHSSLAPWCLYAGVKAYCKSDITAKVVEGTINEKTENITERLIAEKPQVIGFCTYIWNVNAVMEIAKRIKDENHDMKIVLGGPEVSYNAYEVLKNNSFIDYISSGEGEQSFAELLESISLNKETQSIPGICYRNNKGIIISDPCICEGEPVSPYCDEYFETLKGRIAYIESSRGCPYSCAFCLSGRCGGVRFFNLENTKQNILKLANSGTKTVKFVDRTFNANRQRAKQIFRFIISNYGIAIPDGVCFHFEIAGDILDEETIGILASAPNGSIQLEIGLQSFNEQTLKYINRKTNTEVLKANILKLIAPRNIHIHIDLIAGLPFEDINSFADSFNIAFSLQPDMLQLGFLKLLYGADMRENSEKYQCKYSTKAPYEVISTEWLSQNDVLRLKQVEDVVERLYNSHRFTRTLKYFLSCVNKSAFDFFDGFAQNLSGIVTDGITLDKYSYLFFKYLLKFDETDRATLRDTMVCDRLSTNSSAVLPDFLKIEDSDFKKKRNALNAIVGENENHKRGMAILYSQNSVVYTDYERKDKVTGEYRLNFVSNDTLL